MAIVAEAGAAVLRDEQEHLVAGVGHRVPGLSQHRHRTREHGRDDPGQRDPQFRRQRHDDRAGALARVGHRGEP